jgi:hypothetical protein
MIEFDARSPGAPQSRPMFDAWASTLGTLTGHRVSAPSNWPNAARHVHRIADAGRDGLDTPEDQSPPSREELRALALIPEQGATPAQLARALHCPGAAAALRLVRLCGRGLVWHDPHTALYFRTEA